MTTSASTRYPCGSQRGDGKLRCAAAAAAAAVSHHRYALSVTGEMAARQNNYEDEVIPPDPTVAEGGSSVSQVEISAPAADADDTEVEDPRHTRPSDPNHAELSGQENIPLEDLIEDISSDEDEFFEYQEELRDPRPRVQAIQREDPRSEDEEDVRYGPNYRNGILAVRRMPADSTRPGMGTVARN
ncbi:hypothetical protein QR680_003085 [Steinernema hermaphroditum]|uniref:Uncharacterized protein n=1 Tax=Steinernema hermaphroditum TaxID=289476 RepID=A0AA39H781_9BILA|nr:hypothetical protein QR680_003085 [Steinernema hermaphroditum]